MTGRGPGTSARGAWLLGPPGGLPPKSPGLFSQRPAARRSPSAPYPDAWGRVAVRALAGAARFSRPALSNRTRSPSRRQARRRCARRGAVLDTGCAGGGPRVSLGCAPRRVLQDDGRLVGCTPPACLVAGSGIGRPRSRTTRRQWCSVALLMPSSAASSASGRLCGGSIFRSTVSLPSSDHPGWGPLVFAPCCGLRRPCPLAYAGR